MTTASVPSSREPWSIVAAGAVLTCVAIGVVFSLAVFLDPISADTGWSRAGISGAMTLGFLAMGVGGFAWGWLGDRFGTRPVVLAGTVLLVLATVLAARATSLLEFQLFEGVLMGFAAGSFFAPVMASTAAWFDKHRSLAVSLVSAGVGVAPMTISPFAAWLVTHHDWRTAQLVIGVGALVLMLPAALCLRSAPPSPAAPTAASGGEPVRVGEALRSKAFIVLAATFFFCCATHAGPIFHTISYAIGCGLPTAAAVTIYSMEGAAGLGGRVLFGVLGDRWGAKKALIAGLLIQAVAAGSYLLVRDLPGFYVVAIVFGLAYGGTMPLYAVLARDYFGDRILGTVLGAASMISSLGMAIGPVAGGWLYDNTGSYAPMYLGSVLVGLGAVGIALLFPRVMPAAPAPRMA
jgi:MFS family permease